MPMLDLADMARMCAESYSASPTFAVGVTMRCVVHVGEGGDRYLIFPGSRPTHLADDFTDLDIGPIQISSGQLAHKGLWEVAMLALPNVIANSMGGALNLGGHSLGAAIAVNVATALSIAGIPVQSVTGFGCPHTAIGPWQRELLASAGVKVTLVRSGGDIVPRLPMHIDHIPLSLACLAHVALPGVGDWECGGAETQIGDGSRPWNIKDHDMRDSYLVALERESALT